MHSFVSTTPPTSAALADSLTERLGQLQQQLESLRTQLTESQRLATIGTISDSTPIRVCANSATATNVASSDASDRHGASGPRSQG